jgi:aerobic carbon-monoxide dehydrogenase large subunit
MKRAIYDESGQLVTASLMNYSLPRARTVFWNSTSRHRDVSSTTALLGLKGARGGGDRLAASHERGRLAHRVEHIHMPATPFQGKILNR